MKSRVDRFTSWNYFHYLWLAVVLASAMIAIAAELYLTRAGAGASGDSVHYMQGAANILAGNGFSRLRANGQTIPITGFPPGFSAVLAGLGLTGLPAFAAGRYLNAILFGLSTILVGWLVYRSTRSGIFAILGSWLFMYARNIVQIHSWIMSEPLFIFLALLSLLLVDLFLQRGKIALLIVAGICIGFTILTRYVGVALIPAACLPILFFSPQAKLKKWRDAILLGVIGLIPVVLWFFHNALLTGNASNRQLIYHPISKDLIFTLFNELSYWWFAPSLSLPWKLRYALLGLFFILGVGVFVYTALRLKRSQASVQVSTIPALFAIFAACYVVVLLLNTLLIDASTDEPSIKRYAIPLVAIGIIWTISTFSLITQQGWGKKITPYLLTLVWLGMVLFYASRSVSFLLHPGYAFGYTDDRHNWTCEVDLLKASSPQQVMITNDYEEFYFLAGRPAYALTGQYDQYLGKNVDDFSASMENVQTMLKDGATLAMLGDPNAYPNVANALIGDMGLVISQACSHLRYYVVPTG
jgi:hypothetical protein